MNIKTIIKGLVYVGCAVSAAAVIGLDNGRDTVDAFLALGVIFFIAFFNSTGTS